MKEKTSGKQVKKTVYVCVIVSKWLQDNGFMCVVMLMFIYSN